MAFIISDFRSVAPAHLRSQTRTLDWLATAHTQAEMTQAAREGRRIDEARFHTRMSSALARFGCGEDKIATRGYELDDCEHTRWREMELYRLHEEPRGAGMSARMQIFERVAGSLLERLHERTAEPPSDLLHVTCTGYVSPSPAQRLVAKRGWGASTRVTHAYHMGCYAAFPALRLARGALCASPPQTGAAPRCDVAHTELCSLHLNPADHRPEQLVVQSLFADGCISYSVTSDVPARLGSPAFEILALVERVIPDSTAAMSWRCAEWGLEMTLARDVPERLAAALTPFVFDMMAHAGLAQDAAREALFAVHPGGPRILDRVQDVLRLEPAQLDASRRVLRERGNLSSATLPHIWLDLAHDERVPQNALVVCLAFGPGLTICGGLLRKLAP